MYYELNKHKKSDSIKWIVAFSLIFVLFVGMITSLIIGVKNNDKEGTPVQESGQESASIDIPANNFDTKSPISNVSNNSFMKLAFVDTPMLTSYSTESPVLGADSEYPESTYPTPPDPPHPDPYPWYSGDYSGETSSLGETVQGVTKIVTATIEPASAVNQKLTWNLAWDTTNGTPSNPVSNYVTLTYDESDNYATLFCFAAFPNNEMILTCTSKDSGVSAFISIICEGQPSSLTINNGSTTGTAVWNTTSEFEISLDNVFHYVGQQFYDNITIKNVIVSGTYKSHDCTIATKTGEVSDVSNEVSGSISSLNLVSTSLSDDTLSITMGKYPLGTYSYKNAKNANRTHYIYKDYVYEMSDCTITVVITAGDNDYSLTFDGYVGVTNVKLNTDVVKF